MGRGALRSEPKLISMVGIEMTDKYEGIEIVRLPSKPSPKPKNRRVKCAVDKHPMDEERAASVKRRRKHKPAYKNIRTTRG
jgi:hypothetical protein